MKAIGRQVLRWKGKVQARSFRGTKIVFTSHIWKRKYHISKLILPFFLKKAGSALMFTSD
ncbi:hypothetical protein C7T94_16595 [Pedobacter yulinensis]|uniref:Uncharacterized protein n=1 Tax=Pedobacter yulinensis TaxID=2126353 RepID=A0A2T3HIX4_9SPHI|nr:hypothetical protein C7T94_16595 [Pedobacter yulinensis]